MRYLGLTLDGRWSFGPHFRQLAPRLESATAALSRLLSNVGGPDLPCWRLYVGIMRSMALYGAPVFTAPDPSEETQKGQSYKSHAGIPYGVVEGGEASRE